jgi:hypothetical protein
LAAGRVPGLYVALGVPALAIISPSDTPDKRI